MDGVIKTQLSKKFNEILKELQMNSPINKNTKTKNYELNNKVFLQFDITKDFVGIERIISNYLLENNEDIIINNAIKLIGELNDHNKFRPNTPYKTAMVFLLLVFSERPSK